MKRNDGYHAWNQVPRGDDARKKRVNAKASHAMRKVMLVVAAVLMLLVAASAVFGMKFYKQAQSVSKHERKALSSLSILNETGKLADAEIADAAIEQAQSETAEAKSIAHGTLWNIAAKIPFVGSDIATVQGMTEVIDSMAQQTLPQLASIMQRLADSDLSDEDGHLNLQPIVDVQNDFSKVNKLMKQQAGKYNTLADPKISVVKNVYIQSKEQVNSVSALINQVNSALQMMPSFLGQNGSRTYLLAVQTPSETRSMGGLVGSLSTMTAESGKIVVGDFHPNAEFINGSNGNDSERSVFSKPLGFSFDTRDTFAVPDISRNAEMLEASWQRSEYACDIDGLIVIDPVFIQKMMEITGDVTLENGTVLTAQNTAKYMLNTIYKEIPEDQQDAYFNYIAKTVMDDAFSNLSAGQLMRVVRIIGELAENRHFYAYTFHEDEVQYFQGAGLAKTIPNSESEPEVGIYLNEQNPSKLGWYIERKGEVTQTSTTTYHVKYTLTNTLTSEEMDACTDYILGGTQKGVGGKPVAETGTSAQRVLLYAPAGGSIDGLTVSGDVRDQSDTTMDGNSLNSSMAYIAPGESVVYEFDVTVSDQATADLKIDQTPGGELENDVTYNY